MQTTFTGFPGEGLNFFKELKDNNSKDWFEANKEDYLTFVRKPALAFIQDLGARLAQISDVTTDIRTNGSGTLMRMNRDTRFSKNKDPYKTNISGMFWDGVGKKTENTAFGFQLEYDKLHLMAGMFQFPKEMLAAYREAVTNTRSGTELQDIIDALPDDYSLEGKHYKKVPRGFDAEHERAELLLYHGIYASIPGIKGDILTKPELLELCFEHFAKMAPLQRWLAKIKRNT